MSGYLLFRLNNLLFFMTTMWKNFVGIFGVLGNNSLKIVLKEHDKSKLLVS